MTDAPKPAPAPAKKIPVASAPPETPIVTLSPQQRMDNAAKAAGANRLIMEHLTTHVMRKVAEGYLRTLGDHARNYERGSNPEMEIVGVRECVAYVKKHYEGPMSVGSAHATVAELQELIKARKAEAAKKAAPHAKPPEKAPDVQGSNQP